jgi:hypothetical protein
VGGVGDELALGLEGRLEPTEESVERVAQLFELVAGAVEGRALVQVGRRDVPRGRRDHPQPAQDAAGDDPAQHDPQPDVATAKLEDGGIAKVTLPGFFPGAADQVLQAIANLRKDATLRGVVLDLRGNVGGDPAKAGKLLSAFVHDKVWYSECDVSGNCTPQRTDTTTPLLNLPLVALADRNCASACHGFSDAVKDLKLGER